LRHRLGRLGLHLVAGQRGASVRGRVLSGRGDERDAMGAVLLEHHHQPCREGSESGDEAHGEHCEAHAPTSARAVPALSVATVVAMSPKASEDPAGESRDGVKLTNLDASLFPGAGATKRELVDYLDAVRERILPALGERPLSVIRVMRGQESFMQKNVPKYTPEWVETVTWWAESSKRDVRYALCNDQRTLLWFANQRAIEYHPALVKVDRPDRITHLVVDLDPPEGGSFTRAVDVALLVRQALDDVGLVGALKTSGAKGLHIFVPIDDQPSPDDAAAALRAIAERAARLDPSIATTAFIKEDREGKVFVDSTRVGGATVVSAYSPRVRPGVPVSFPLAWDALGGVEPSDFTIHTVLDVLGDRDPWAEHMPAPQSLGEELIAEGHQIPVARVQAMHEGKRRARAEHA
jgi:DNA ligase D